MENIFCFHANEVAGRTSLKYNDKEREASLTMSQWVTDAYSNIVFNLLMQFGMSGKICSDVRLNPKPLSCVWTGSVHTRAG